MPYYLETRFVSVKYRRVPSHPPFLPSPSPLPAPPLLPRRIMEILAPVVQRVDNAIQWISIGKTNYAILWIDAIHPLNNWGLVLTNLAALSVLSYPKKIEQKIVIGH